MRPEFKEVFPCFGVDVERPTPAMIVPRRGSNMFAVLGGEGVSVTTDARNLHLKEINRAARDANPDIIKLSALLSDAEKTSAALRHDARIFSVTGSELRGGAKGGAITARLGKETAVLRAVVLDEKVVNIAIRELYSIGPDGKLARHSKNDHNIAALVEIMNLIWRPQTNITFKATKTDFFPVQEVIPESINIQEYKDKLAAGKGGEKYAMFFVAVAASRKVSSSARMDLAHGWTDIKSGVAIIGDIANRSTMAHEAGHLLGQEGHPPANKTHLLQDGGPGIGLGKIPFDKAIGLFNAKY